MFQKKKKPATTTRIISITPSNQKLSLLRRWKFIGFEEEDVHEKSDSVNSVLINFHSAYISKLFPIFGFFCVQ